MRNKPLPDSVLHASGRILDDFALCDSCLGRMHARQLRLVSCRALGSRIRSALGRKKTRKCHVCHDLLDRLGGYVDQLQSISQDTHYDTFLIGAILRPSVMDRDDQLRSRFKTRGADGIKGEITRSLTASFARRTGRTPDGADPDLTLLVNLKTGICEQRARSVTICGRYTKTKRGLPQKQSPCEDCRGRGCIFCGNRGITGFDSVEGMISQFLYGRFGCTRARFTWVGGEDRDSLVGGAGRPFFAKLTNPKKRNVRLFKRADLDGAVILGGLCRVARIPAVPVRFRSRAVLHVQSEAAVPASRLRVLADRLEADPIAVTDGGRSVLRRIHRAEPAMVSADSFTLSVLADGGMPLKRLVDGGTGGGKSGSTGGCASPSVSEILGIACTCTRFDFEDIEVDGSLTASATATAPVPPAGARKPRAK